MANIYDFLVHSVAVSRDPLGVTGGRVSDGPWVTVYTALACLVEPLNTQTRETLFGRLAQARFKMLWSDADEYAVGLSAATFTPALIEGDRITYNGKTYVLREIEDDSGRMGFSQLTMKTGILVLKGA
ncbi:MAG: hypothetical protein ACYCW6_27760 [Candidatus Xenobia bacterium]